MWLGPGDHGARYHGKTRLFMLLKEGCRRISYKLEHPQPYTFTDLLSWYRHHDWGDLNLFGQVSCKGPVTHSYELIVGCLPGVTPTTLTVAIARVKQRTFDWSGNQTLDLSHDNK